MRATGTIVCIWATPSGSIADKHIMLISELKPMLSHINFTLQNIIEI